MGKERIAAEEIAVGSEDPGKRLPQGLRYRPDQRQEVLRQGRKENPVIHLQIGESPELRGRLGLRHLQIERLELH